MRRTKIIATVGPATSSLEILRELVKAGVDMFRLNFSHGTRMEKREVFDNIRLACRDEGREVAVMQDLCGPKIRVGSMKGGGATLEDGAEIVVSPSVNEGNALKFGCTYESLSTDVSPGDPILLDDGAIELKVIGVSGVEVRCRVVHGGFLKEHKGINLPGTKVSSPSVTEKDIGDLHFGLDLGVDYTALSFVRHPDDIKKVRRILKRYGSETGIVAKIEKPEALEHIDEIIDEADGIMVARGDLGVEMDLARVPMIQKDIIRRANEADKFVITATQMLESMTENPSPTRAEVADVANAVIDGTDALMLSGETAIGRHPLDAVKMMNRVAVQTEKYLFDKLPVWNQTMINEKRPVADAIGHAVLELCRDLEIGFIVAYSRTGETALFLSKSRPFARIITFTPDERSFRRMRPYWGVEPVLDTTMTDTSDLRRRAMEVLRDRNLAKPGDLFLLVAGTHFGRVGATDTIEIAVMR